jgi:hypothetical protein
MDITAVANHQNLAMNAQSFASYFDQDQILKLKSDPRIKTLHISRVIAIALGFVSILPPVLILSQAPSLFARIIIGLFLALGATGTGIFNTWIGGSPLDQKHQLYLEWGYLVSWYLLPVIPVALRSATRSMLSKSRSEYERFTSPKVYSQLFQYYRESGEEMQLELVLKTSFSGEQEITGCHLIPPSSWNLNPVSLDHGELDVATRTRIVKEHGMFDDGVIDETEKQIIDQEYHHTYRQIISEFAQSVSQAHLDTIPDPLTAEVSTISYERV